ncbi:MAG: hypothetical protein WBO70_01630 [Erysipelotrichaceae bacterium]
MKNNKVEVLFKWIMFTAAICGMGLISGFYPIQANIPLIVIPSIMVLLFSKPVFFEKLKLTTLLTMRIVIIFAALNFFNPQIYVDIILLMLIINILEATFTDIFRYKKYLNGISGIALALGVIGLRGAWAIGAPFGSFYLVGGATLVASLAYIVAYTIWNWVFVTNEFSDSVALMHVGFLLAPIIGCVCTLGLGAYGGFGMWLLLRANTLAIGGWLQIGAKQWFEKEFASEGFSKFVNFTKQTNVQVVLMIINVALIGIVLYLGFATNFIGFQWAL